MTDDEEFDELELVDMVALEADLDQLEATDPDVAAAAAKYRLVRERILRGIAEDGPA